jgi:hypothetical protein
LFAKEKGADCLRHRCKPAPAKKQSCPVISSRRLIIAP